LDVKSSPSKFNYQSTGFPKSCSQVYDVSSGAQTPALKTAKFGGMSKIDLEKALEIGQNMLSMNRSKSIRNEVQVLSLAERRMRKEAEGNFR
jgi:hypothetical protein